MELIPIDPENNPLEELIVFLGEVRESGNIVDLIGVCPVELANGKSEIDGDGEDGRTDIGGYNGHFRPLHRAPTPTPCRHPNSDIPPDGECEREPNGDRVTDLEEE